MSKPSAKQIRFAELVASGSSQADAYRNAGYKVDVMDANAIRVEAHKVAQNPNVSLMIAEIQAENREKLDVTTESITRELEEARIVAAGKEQGSAMVAASMGKAKLHGLITDKVEVKDNFRDEVRKAAEDMNAKEAAELYARERNGGVAT